MATMPGWNEDDHPRHGGKFVPKGGPEHIADVSDKAIAKGNPETAGKRHRAREAAHRDAAERAKTPAERAVHLAHAAQAAGMARMHEWLANMQGAKTELRGDHGMAKWALNKLDKIKEHVKESGERVQKVEEAALAEGGMEKGAIEAARAVGEGAAGAAKAAVPGHPHHHGKE